MQNIYRSDIGVDDLREEEQGNAGEEGGTGGEKVSIVGLALAR